MQKSLARKSVRTNSRSVTVLLSILVALVAAACSSGGDSTVTQTSLPTAEEALENARTAMADVPQFRFVLSHPEGKTSLPGGLDLRRAEGTVLVPERLSVEAEANLGRVFVRVEAVVIEGQTWMTNPLTGNWATIAPQDSPFAFLDPVRLVTNVLAQTTEPVYPANGGIRGGEIVLDGKVPSEALQPLVGTVIPDALLDVTLTIDSESFLLKSARLKGRLQPGDDSSFVRLITFSGFGDALSIEPPI